ncbi:MAG: 4Fe-4S dicluster-binding protein [Chloroflexota bacterium]
MKQKRWKELNAGAVITEPGSSERFKTGSWRSFRPVWKPENCIQCLLCWMWCPDMSITVVDGKRGDFDYDFCKGCGICAVECPRKDGQKVIAMIEEVG